MINFLFNFAAFTCNGGKEIDRSQVCDGERDCMEGEDEDAAMCGGTGSGGSGCKYYEMLRDENFFTKRKLLVPFIRSPSILFHLYFLLAR